MRDASPREHEEWRVECRNALIRAALREFYGHLPSIAEKAKALEADLRRKRPGVVCEEHAKTLKDTHRISGGKIVTCETIRQIFR